MDWKIHRRTASERASQPADGNLERRRKKFLRSTNTKNFSVRYMLRHELEIVLDPSVAERSRAMDTI